ncbi:MAG: preprotein translocase subunit SecA [Chitinophagales bacterium]|nr:preprotein translocase subunit SecA [Chitinophagales bacterium]
MAIGDIFGKLFGSKHLKDIKGLSPLVDQINGEWNSLQQNSHDELRNKTHEFREIIKEGLKEITSQIDALNQGIEDDPDMDVDLKEKTYLQIDKLIEEKDDQLEKILDNILPKAFAVVKETANRFMHNKEIEVTATDLDRDLAVDKENIIIKGDKAIYQNEWMAAGSLIQWNMLHYDVQLIGGIVLHQGKIAEMATGEGKTLVATLPTYLNGLSGDGVHIVTVNDYLARRDSEWMAPILNFLGLTVDCIDKYKPHSEDRIAAYNADVTYGTNNEFGFDYLRDNMVRNPDELVQGKLHFAMVDEVDSVLVDDARTPLIISGPVETSNDKQFYDMKPRIQKLYDVQKKLVSQYIADAKRLIAEGNDGPKEGEGGLALLRAHRALPRTKPLIKYLSEPGIKQILQKTENYYLQEQAKNMPLVDDQLYFVIDEKNNTVELSDKGVDLITTENEEASFFIMPDVGAEIADIEKSEFSDEEKIEKKDKLMQDFAIKSERIHTLNQLLKSYSLFEKDIDYVVMDGKVKIVDENTGRIMEGRRYSDGLHQAIEAKENVKVEAPSQTFATVTLQNYFRMYHKLAGMTGTAETEASEFWDIYKLDVVVIPTNRPIVRDDREDLVFRTTREKYNAIIDDVVEMAESGRPVLVGTTSVEVSELIARMLKRKNIPHNVLNAKQHQREADIVATAGQGGAVTIATNMAGRGTDIKINKQVINAGGLGIIGSERHESRRIDRQLRGRAGRQGDPGSSQFYVSLEDNLMRLFGSERIAKVMDRLGYKEGEVIQHSMITKSIERAQRKVEENNFGIRKRLLEYDDVMNTQREVIYKKRKHALFGERLSLDIMNTFYDLCEELIDTFREEGNYEEFKLNVIRYFAIDTTISQDEFFAGSLDSVTKDLFHEVQSAYKRKCDAMVKTSFPVFQNIHKNRGETVKQVVVPISDGSKGLQILVDLEKTMDSNGRELIRSFEKSISLALLDDAWKEHLRKMDDLKQEVQAAVYEQKDPLLIYKLEAYNLFKMMISEVNRSITAFLFKGNIPVQDPSQVHEGNRQKTNLSGMKTSREDKALATPNQNGGPPRRDEKKLEPVRVGAKVGRNDPCPCGSGKKYKKCHGANG